MQQHECAEARLTRSASPGGARRFAGRSRPSALEAIRVDDEVELGRALVDNGRTVTRLRKSKSVIANSAPEGGRRGLGSGRAYDT